MEFFSRTSPCPELVKTQLATITDFKSVRAGYTRNGIPSNINVVRSLKEALARRTALRAGYARRIREAEETMARAEEDDSEDSRAETEENILRFRRRMRAIPFIDTFDLRYNNRIRQPRPSSRAVMFCLMDVSGSSGRATRTSPSASSSCSTCSCCAITNASKWSSFAITPPPRRCRKTSSSTRARPAARSFPARSN